VSLSLEALEEFATGLVAAPERWRRFVRHGVDERVYEQIWSDEDVNAWVICWSADNDTGFHDHDASAAGIAVIAGRVMESRLTIGGRPRTRSVGAGQTISIPPSAIHRVQHDGDGPAVTIHAYSPPLVRVGTYSITVSGELERRPVPYQEELRAESTLAA
jgi:quercetin dioxygenase-like cupin family protein